MDTSKYRQLLAAFNEQVSSCDSQAGRLTNRWLQSFDTVVSSTPTRFVLMERRRLIVLMEEEEEGRLIMQMEGRRGFFVLTEGMERR